MCTEYQLFPLVPLVHCRRAAAGRESGSRLTPPGRQETLYRVRWVFSPQVKPGEILPELCRKGNAVNNFMRCHRFDLVRCRKPTRYSVTGPIVYTIIHLPVYGSFPDSFLHSAASNYLTSLDTAFCILVGNCAQAIHNSQAGRPVSSGRPAFPSLLLNCPFNPHTSPNSFFAHSWISRAVRSNPLPGIPIPLPGHTLWLWHPLPICGRKASHCSKMCP